MESPTPSSPSLKRSSKKEKPKLPPKPVGLSSKPSNEKTDSPPVGRLRLQFARVFSLRGGSTSTPPSPTTKSPIHRTPHSNSLELLPQKLSPGKIRRSLGSTSSDQSDRIGSVSSEPGSEANADLTPSPKTKRRIHWKSKSDSVKVRNFLKKRQQ